MRKIKPIKMTYQYCHHLLPYTLSMKKHALVQQQPDLQTCLNNSFELFADTVKFEDLISNIAEKSPSGAKGKGKRLKKGRQSDDDETPSESESELEEQVRKKKKNQKIKINSSRAKAGERKERKKGSGSELEQEYDGRFSLHVDNGTEFACNPNNILGMNKELEDEDSDSGLKI